MYRVILPAKIIIPLLYITNSQYVTNSLYVTNTLYVTNIRCRHLNLLSREAGMSAGGNPASKQTQRVSGAVKALHVNPQQSHSMSKSIHVKVDGCQSQPISVTAFWRSLLTVPL